MAQLNNDYKSRHKPVLEGMKKDGTKSKMKFHLGYFIPTIHPEKCLTKDNIFRSSWELKFFDWCDRCDLVVRWASEPVAIEYRNPVTNLEFCNKNHLNPKDPHNWKIAKYYTDVWIELRTKDGEGIRKIFIEIKPFDLTQKPKPLPPNAKLKDIKRFNTAALTYLVNQAKWAAANQEFKKRGCEFMVVTEKTLKKLGILNY